MGNVTSNGTSNTSLPSENESLPVAKEDETLHNGDLDFVNSRLKSTLCRLNKMRKEEIVCDYVIKGRNKAFPVHKLLMAAASDYFYSEFSTNRRFIKEGVLVLAEADDEAITQCIEFMYTGKATLKPENAEKILPYASLLQLTVLIQNCENMQESGNEIVIEVHNYAEALFSKLKNMRRNGYLCDSSLIVQSDSLPVHAVVLTAWSGYFEAVFKSNLRQKSIKLNDFTTSAVEKCIDAAYTGSLPQDVFQTPDNLVEILSVLEEFQFRDMVGDCYDVIMKTLSPENSLQMWLLCDVRFCQPTAEIDIKKEVMKYLVENFGRMIKSEKFYLLKKSQFLRLLQEYVTSNPEHVTSDVKVRFDVTLAFQATKNWIEYDIIREKYIFEIMQLLNLENLPIHDLFNIFCDALIQKFYSSRTRLLTIILSRPKSAWMELINTENCFKLKKIATTFDCDMSKNLTTVINLFILKNLGELSDRKEWHELPAETIAELLEVEDIDYAQNRAKWLGLISWMKQDAKRKTSFLSLADLINFERMSTEYLQTTVTTEALIDEFPTFKAMISDIISQRSSDKPRIRIIHPSIKKIQQNYE